ncbi:MAG: hypothetical protein PHO55_05425, partial [Thiomonas arsenitoxydans]|nr:hypothetical protein [Thiomonas arsenitoxydans]
MANDKKLSVKIYCTTAAQARHYASIQSHNGCSRKPLHNRPCQPSGNKSGKPPNTSSDGPCLLGKPDRSDATIKAKTALPEPVIRASKSNSERNLGECAASDPINA